MAKIPVGRPFHWLQLHCWKKESHSSLLELFHGADGRAVLHAQMSKADFITDGREQPERL